jgi:hypothetical protein
LHHERFFLFGWGCSSRLLPVDVLNEFLEEEGELDLVLSLDVLNNSREPLLNVFDGAFALFEALYQLIYGDARIPNGLRGVVVLLLLHQGLLHVVIPPVLDLHVSETGVSAPRVEHHALLLLDWPPHPRAVWSLHHFDCGLHHLPLLGPSHYRWNQDAALAIGVKLLS